MNKIFKWLLLVNLIFLLCGCTTSLGHVKMLSTKAIPMEKDRKIINSQEVSSSSCSSVEEAVKNLLNTYQADYIEDVEIVRDSFGSMITGYTIKGKVGKIEN